MSRNGSGVMTPSIDFTTEAGAPPIEISKLDTVLDDIADEITNSLAADGQTSPTANIKLNGFKLVNVGAPTVLTDAVTATTVIDQELQYYVDSGSANTYAITPSPAIAAYEEGQRFVIRIANASSGASTLNVNGLGAVAIQTADGTAIATGTLDGGGIYEFTYDANTSPDRWVVTSPTSKIPDGVLSSNVPLKSAANTFLAGQLITAASATLLQLRNTDAAENQEIIGIQVPDAGGFAVVFMNDVGASVAAPINITRSTDTATELALTATALNLSGTLSTPNASASEVGFNGVPAASDETPVLTDAGKLIVATGNVTIPANGSVAYPVQTVLSVFNSTGGAITIDVTTDTLTLAATTSTGQRTLAQNGLATLVKITSTTWVISGAGIS